MMKVYSKVEELVGHTPVLSFTRIKEKFGIRANLLAKLESFNPASSAKDRIALKMILDAEETGALRKGSVIIEPTSGNTGIGLAAIGCARGYRVIIVMPDSMSVERRLLMTAYGAEVVLTPGAEGMKGAIAKAEELSKTMQNSFIPSQFENPSNPMAHYITTAPEIWEATEGKVDAFVAGIGTGGTISGCARFFKEKNPSVHVVGVEPKDSPLLTEGKAGPHALQGIGANFIPDTLDPTVLNEILSVSREEAFAT
ncbi:MAG: cysteine synthase family protein, partial [Clostridia bacterium]|nr:cysteine synthase family protein [Clostridia bacterium]